ncbi:MAG TPA: arsenosugar biosynthesis radical SAM protein ArsS [Thermoanaerobaculia bacterium]|nr:arsenosugar biosynthesis radical SAM protein ArsS [Thermoanaerobaculia bacterium]
MTLSLHARGAPLAAPEKQVAAVESVDLSASAHGGDFARALAASGRDALRPGPVEIFQINLGKLCNMTCRHCHVDAGPDRTDEMMDRATAEACLAALDRTGAHTVDLTGGAPELNPNFRYVVDEAAARGKHVIDRCNLTILLVSGFRDLPAWLGERGVEIVCSLPHWRKRGTDAQRGDGTYEKSLQALHLLNEAGYGSGDPRRTLTLVSNPVGAFLPANQRAAEREWKEGLLREHGVAFDRLIFLNNMPISRYLEWLESSGNLASYLELLVASFNPATIDGLMCRNTLSIGWDGRIYDCDFNQMLDLPARGSNGAFHVRDLDVAALAARTVVTRRHCFGCTAGAGSSCGGALE